jgi:hypothetical protein
MGNVLPKNLHFSTEKKENMTPEETITLSSQIDDIAIHYILKQNTIDLLRLSDKEYYDNLIILTTKIFNEKLSPFEIGALSHKIKGETTIQNAVFNLIPSNEKMKKQMIENISKYYIKLLTIYSAIVSTIDPQYSYEDETGEKQFFYLKDIESYKQIPKNSKPALSQLSNPMNLCRKRISILKNKLDMNDESFVTINPGEKLCESPMIFKLNDEIGIKELDLLYYDVFDYNTKEWSKQSKEMKKKYNKDLTLFYQVFTGNKVKPIEIQSFKDIELLDFKGLNYCNDTFFKKDMMIPKNHHLIQKYLQKIQLIEDHTSLFRQKLISILKQIFLIKTESSSNEPTYIINPELTMDMILQIENETRDTIIKLYSSCERYFIQAILIFEELYDEQNFNVSKNRENEINKSMGIIPPIMGEYSKNNENFRNNVIEPLYNHPFNTKEPPQQELYSVPESTPEIKPTNEYKYIPKEEQLFYSPVDFEHKTKEEPITLPEYNPIYDESLTSSVPTIIEQPKQMLQPYQTINSTELTNPSNYLKTYSSIQPAISKNDLMKIPQPAISKNDLMKIPQPAISKNDLIKIPQPTISQNIPSYQREYKPSTIDFTTSKPIYEQPSTQQYSQSLQDQPPLLSSEKPYNIYSQRQLKPLYPIKNEIQQFPIYQSSEKPYLKQPETIQQNISKIQSIPLDLQYQMQQQSAEPKTIEAKTEDPKGIMGTIMNAFKPKDSEEKTEISQPYTSPEIAETTSKLKPPSEQSQITSDTQKIISNSPTESSEKIKSETEKQIETIDDPSQPQPLQDQQVEQPKSFFSMFSDSLKKLTSDNKPVFPTQPEITSTEVTPQIQQETTTNPEITTIPTQSSIEEIKKDESKIPINPIVQI